MSLPVEQSLDLKKNAIIAALLDPVASDPGSPGEGQVWFRTDIGRLNLYDGGAVKSVAFTTDAGAGAINATDYNASTILAADADDTPLPLTIPASTLVGRQAAGGIDALTAAEVRTLLGIEAGATADQTAAEILAALLTVDGPASSLDADLLDGQQGSFYATASSVVGLASEAYVDGEINSLIAAAPGTLDTLNELAAALGDDPNFATTVTNSLATKPTKYAVDIGDGTSTTLTVTHSLGTYDVRVELYYTATKKTLLAEVTRTTINAIEVTFGTAPAAGSIRCMVLG